MAELKMAESGLTMDDYISREAALACFTDWIDRYGHEHTADEMVEYQKIEDLPVEDVVEVVRCRDCINWNLDTHPRFIDGHFCPNIEFETEADFFCADGERRCEHDPDPSDPGEVP